MINSNTPICYKTSSKPSKFCPGCGYSLTLKNLGFVIDQLKIQDKTSLFLDIGCNLLTWDFFDIPTTQTHHGRTVSTAVGYKMVQPKRVVLALVGDGGGYAIGLQNLIHTALRNNPVTVILVNNSTYAMTGGQMSPTTLLGDKTATTPNGRTSPVTGKTFSGLELVKSVADKNAYLARGTVEKPQVLKKYLEKAIQNQIENNQFSMVEILSYCPLNWKTDAEGSIEKNKKMQEFFPCGELNGEIK